VATLTGACPPIDESPNHLLLLHQERVFISSAIKHVAAHVLSGPLRLRDISIFILFLLGLKAFTFFFLASPSFFLFFLLQLILIDQVLVLIKQFLPVLQSILPLHELSSLLPLLVLELFVFLLLNILGLLASCLPLGHDIRNHLHKYADKGNQQEHG
jgi:hypothetical protein